MESLITALKNGAAGTVDHVSLGADIELPAGFAFQTGQSVLQSPAGGNAFPDAETFSGAWHQAHDQRPDQTGWRG